MNTEILVVGAGVAGLRAAIELAQAGEVLVVAKDTLHESSSEYAQGGIAVALSDDDEVELHEQDTIAAGDGLCDRRAVHVLVEQGPAAIQQLIEWGAAFDREGSRLAFTREGSVCGAIVYDETARECVPIHARAVLLATGGLGRIYLETTNPDIATGDGVAMAWRAGAEISDLEFVQFHPTALHVEGAPRFLLSEALRGEGAFLRNGEGERFMERYHPLKELAPRD